MSTETAASGLGRTSTAGRPSTPGGSVRPSPVAHRMTTEPRLAGLATELTLLSWFRMDPCPVPLALAVNKPGAVALTGTLSGSLRTPWYSTRAHGEQTGRRC